MPTDPTPPTTVVHFLGLPITVVGAPEIAAALDTISPVGAPDPPPPVAGAAVRIEAERLPDGWRLRCTLPDGSETYRAPDIATIVSGLEPVLAATALDARPGHLPLHAGGVRVGEGAVLIFGDSGSGKSSLSLACSLEGCELLGDDTVLLDDLGLVHALPRFAKVTAQWAREVGIDPTPTPWYDPEDPEVWIDPGVVGAGFAAGGHRVVGIVHVRFTAGAVPELRVLDAREALQVLGLGRLYGDALTPEEFDRLLAVVPGARGFELNHGDSRAAARHLIDAFAGKGKS